MASHHGSTSATLENRQSRVPRRIRGFQGVGQRERIPVEQLVVERTESQSVYLDVRSPCLPPLDVGGYQGHGLKPQIHVKAANITTELSGMTPAMSGSWTTSWNMSAQTPFSSQRAYRLNTLFHLPQLSGSLRHWASVRSIQWTASTRRRHFSSRPAQARGRPCRCA